MKTPQDTAERIKALAKEQKTSVSKLLSDCEINKNALFTMQTEGYYPRVEAIIKIADYLDCSVDYLLGRTDIPEVNRGGAEIINITPKEEFTGELAAFGGDIKSNPKKKKPQHT